MITRKYHKQVNKGAQLRQYLYPMLVLWACSQAVYGQSVTAQQSTIHTPAHPSINANRFILLNANTHPTTPQHAICARDTRSGLIWEIKSPNKGLRYRHNTYTWYTLDTRNNGGFNGNKNGGRCTGSRCDTTSYVGAINHLKLCGLSHWRLPTRRELDTLIDYRIRYPGPMLDVKAFPQTVSQFYWSSTPDANDKDSAWGIGFSFGFDFAYFKIDAARVRLVHDALPGKPRPAQMALNADIPLPVSSYSSAANTQHCQAGIRATAPTSHYLAGDDGTVVDRDSRLMWMRCPLGQHWRHAHCAGKATTFTLAAARNAVAKTRYAGYQDWRLPDITELSLLTELQCEYPAINLTVFPDTTTMNVWSGTPFANDQHKQWQVEFHHGENLADLKSSRAAVRLVRTTGPSNQKQNGMSK